MADLLNIGSSALYAAMKGLDLTGHNIANVGTEGYSRQRVDQSARPGNSISRIDSGGGVAVNGTQRLNDALVESALVRDGAELARLTAFDRLAQRTDALLSDPASGLANSLTSFFNGLEQVASDPASTAARQAALGTAQSLADRFGSLQDALSAIDTEIDTRLKQAVATVNDLSASIAKLNRSVASAGQSVPADLLDQRATLLRQLSEQLGVSTVPQDDGSLNVFTSSGQPLVVGEKTMPLSTADDLYRPNRLDVTSGGASVGTQLGGGLIGGLLDARRTLIDPAMGQLGRMAVTVATEVNRLQSEGLTSTGAVGAALFTAPQGRAFAARTNTGSASVQVAFGDVGALKGGDYLLRSTGSGWQLTRAGTGEAVAMSGSGSAADPLVFEGLRLIVAGTAAVGDSFRVSPTHDAAAGLTLATHDPAAIAAAGRLSASASLANTGSGKLSAPTVVDPGDAQLGTPATITFLGANSYRVGSGPAVAYAAGDTISANGWAVTLDGTAAAGDTFTIGPTPAGSGDNRNARALAGLAQLGLLDGGRTTLAGANSALVTQTGATALQVSTAKSAAEAVQTQSQSQRDAISGVNLDEEAANLVRYQQAYQAAAQVIATASSLFDTLLAATRK